MSLRPRHHRFIRMISVAVTAASLTYMAQRSNVRGDVTEEGLSQVTDATRELVASIDESRPVVIHAYVSDEVPREYVPTRSRLLNILREFEASAGPGLTVRIISPEPYSEEAQEASDAYGIAPVRLMEREGGRLGEMQVFLGLAMVSGPHEEVIPFFPRGLSVEYELVRALRTVTQEKKMVVGVLRTDAPIMGNFDLQARRQQPAWRVVGELRKQYEVRSLNPETTIPEDVNVLLVPQLASLTQPEIDKVKEYVDAGRPALVLLDPYPLFNLGLAPSEPKPPPPGQQNPMMGGMNQGPPKGDFVGFLRDVGVEWDPDRIVFDIENPDTNLAQAPPHLVVVAERSGDVDPFGPESDPIVRDLESVVTLFGGAIKPASGAEGSFIPLLSTGKQSGYHKFDDLVDRGPLSALFGIRPGPIPRDRTLRGENQVLAARIEGAGSSGEGAKPRNLIVIADLDMIGDQFFELRERGGDFDNDGLIDLRFDNVTFLLNAIDTLAGDDSLVELRKRTAKYRRLTAIDDDLKDAREKREQEIKAANDAADAELEEAKTALQQKVAEIEAKEGLDETAKAVLLKSAEEAENRRLRAKTERIERDKEKAITRSDLDLQAKIDERQNQVRLIAVLAPPIPALLLGGFIFSRRRRREQDAIPASRKRA